jgi:hypothetical protein
MIDILLTTQVILEQADFTVSLTSMDRSSVLCFEDDTLMGFVFVFEDPAALISGWKATEASLLNRYAPSFRVAGQKAWNVYCVFLCGPAVDRHQSRAIRWIEEDLDRTRKIAGCGLRIREDVSRTLMPILPLQYQPLLQIENATERLESRIRAIAPQASGVVLNDAVAPTQVAQLLGDAS